MFLTVDNGPLQYSESYQNIFTLSFSIIIAISVLVVFLLKNKSEKIKRIPLYIIGGILVVLEISKQIKNLTGFYTQHYFSFLTGETAELDYWAFPFHFCSFFVFWCLFQLIFMNNKKLSLFFDNMAFIWSTFIVALVIVYPGMVFGGTATNVYETGVINSTTLFHLIVLLYWGIALGLRTYKFDIKKLYQAPLCFIIYGAIVIPAVHIFKQNYCSLYFPDGWDFLEPIYAKGIVVYDAFLVLLGVILVTIVYLACIGIGKLRDKVKDNKWYQIGYLAMIPGMIILFTISKNNGYDQFGYFYFIYLLLVAFICELPATIIGHTKELIKSK